MHQPDPDNSATRASWEWLVDLAPRLNVAIEVLDEQHAPLAPIGRTADAAALRRMLAAGEPSLCAAVAEAMRSTMPVPVAVDGMQALCLGVAHRGALLLARRLAEARSADDCLRDLDAIGSWLAGAIEAGLADPGAVSVEPYRIVSFRRILREAIARGSIRSVMGAFVEALSVWDEVCVHAYVAGASGGFLPYASSIAATPSPSSDQLDDAVLPRDGRMVRLPRAEVERLGLPVEPGDTLIHTICIGSHIEWLLVFSGVIDEREAVRLRVYSDILRESLNEALAAASSRVVAEVSRRQPPRQDQLQAAAHTALRQLTAAAGGRDAALAVTTPAGRQAVAVGDADLLHESDARGPRLLVRWSDSGGAMTLAVEREQPPFTAFDREIVEAGVAAMHPWLQPVFRRASDVDRRRRPQPLDALFDRLAEDATAAGHQASVIVMSVDGEELRPGLMRAWLGRIRAQIRGDDRAGILSEREVAVLLYGASERQAEAVSARLAQLADSEDGAGPFLYPSIGMTTRVPYAPFEGSLIEAARASAAASR